MNNLHNIMYTDNHYLLHILESVLKVLVKCGISGTIVIINYVRCILTFTDECCKYATFE